MEISHFMTAHTLSQCDEDSKSKADTGFVKKQTNKSHSIGNTGQVILFFQVNIFEYPNSNPKHLICQFNQTKPG